MIRRNQVRVPLFGKWENQKYLMSRSLLGLLGVALLFYAIGHITLTDANILSRLNPAFVTLFSCWFLKEKISKLQWPALVVIFICAVLVVKPSFDLTVVPALCAVGTAICAGGTYTIIRFLKGREEPATIVFYFSFISVAGMIPFVCYNFVMPNPVQLAWLIAIGISASFGQFGLTLAYKYSKAAEVSIYSYSTIIFAALLGFVFENEVPDALSVIGGIGIVGTAVVLFCYNKRKKI